MTNLILDAVERSILETVEAFVRFRPGFHGDTGVRDYLYHRLMTNLPNGGLHEDQHGGGTLLAQAEWYTTLPYRRTGAGSSFGRFDIGIPHPEDLRVVRPRPLAAFECGRNKKASDLLRDVDAHADHEGPAPGDITKLVREISHAALPHGYALEFYDKGSCGEAHRVLDRVQTQNMIRNCDSFHLVVAICAGGEPPTVRFLPEAWDRQVRRKFGEDLGGVGRLQCQSIRARPSHSRKTGASRNRVTREEFLSSSSPVLRDLITSVEGLSSELYLIFGGNTMTVNRAPVGRLLRINKVQNTICDLAPSVRQSLAQRLNRLPIDASYPIDASQRFRTAVTEALSDLH